MAFIVRDEGLVGFREWERRQRFCVRVGVGGWCELGTSSEPALERVTRAVGEEGGHARCGEAGGWLGDVVAVFVGGVAVDTLTLCFAPADAPC